MNPWLETWSNETTSLADNLVFNLDIVEPKEFPLAEDYLSEGFVNGYKYQLGWLKFLPLNMVC